jgi:hypothetical protein
MPLLTQLLLMVCGENGVFCKFFSRMFLLVQLFNARSDNAVLIHVSSRQRRSSLARMEASHPTFSFPMMAQPLCFW